MYLNEALIVAGSGTDLLHKLHSSVTMSNVIDPFKPKVEYKFDPKHPDGNATLRSNFLTKLRIMMRLRPADSVSDIMESSDMKRSYTRKVERISYGSVIAWPILAAAYSAAESTSVSHAPTMRPTLDLSHQPQPILRSVPPEKKRKPDML